MPLLSFTSQFAPLVESGRKRQTIRLNGKRKFRAGDRLIFYTGPYRPGERRKIGEAICLSAQPIKMEIQGLADCGRITGIWLGGRTKYGEEISCEEAENLAVADGFLDLVEMGEYFGRTCLPKDGNGDVDISEGVLLKWGEIMPPQAQLQSWVSALIEAVDSPALTEPEIRDCISGQRENFAKEAPTAGDKAKFNRLCDLADGITFGDREAAAQFHAETAEILGE